ncbi:MAG: zinc ribbon domain-containing protein [Firmicutes bacterium]|nr:zinc ribbon domain-containing protein [Bacillota bacterium]
MYCKKCGKELHDEDRFCSNCGTPVVHETIEEVSEASDGAVRKKLIDTGEFVWDVHDFNKPARKVENVKVDWEKGTVIEETEEIAEEIIEEAIEEEVIAEEVIDAAREAEPETVSETEQFAGIDLPKIDESFAWTAPISIDDIEKAILEEKEAMEAEEIVFNGELPEADDVAVTIEDIEKDVITSNPNRDRDTARIDKFYTLNKKNEEFQKLLDMEYERIMSGKEGTYIMPGSVSRIEEEIAEEVTEEIVPEDVVIEGPAPVTEEVSEPEVFDPVAHLKKAEEERNAALGIGTSVSSMAEYYENQKESGVYYDENGEEMRIFDTMELQKDLLGEAQAQKSKNEIINEISDKIANTKEDIERTYTSLLDEIFGQISEAGISTAAAAAAAGTAGVFIEKAIDEEPELQEETIEDVQPEVVQTEEAPSDVIEDIDDIIDIPENPDDTKNDLSFFDEEDDDEPKKSKAGKVILVIIILLLLIEFAILGIKHFAPDSKAAAFINDKLAQVAELFKGDEGSGNDGDQDVETGDDTEGDVVPPVDERETPSADLTNVIASSGSTNKNISSITYSADVKYDADHKYNTTLLASSKPLESNILYVEGDVKHYVDEEAVQTVIAYNSGWIDYVNSGDKAIFDVLKSGSDAWKNTEGFNSKGITKKFDSLKIGEIRTDGKDSYYVWANEVITTTKSGKTTTDEFNWVYHMELVDGKLLIVDYYK